MFRSSRVMVVGDPAQIKPVVTLDASILTLLGTKYGVSEKYLSDSASTQTLVDSAGKYGFYRSPDKSEQSWIGIPLWVHRRCRYPMFDISNAISYDGLMVQGKKEYGKTGWFNVSGNADDKYVKEQGDFLANKILAMNKANPKILDKNAKDVIYVITPFTRVAFQLSERLDEIGFTRRDKRGKPLNIGTIHTFQGKEAPIVFVVMGADSSNRGSACWAVSEHNMMNVAATRAKEEFYVVGDKDLYLEFGSSICETVIRTMNRYKRDHPELIDEIAAPYLSSAKASDAAPAASRKPAAARKPVASDEQPAPWRSPARAKQNPPTTRRAAAPVPARPATPKTKPVFALGSGRR